MRKIITLALLYSTISTPAISVEIGSVTGYEIPRFVSTKSIPVNVRTGPGRRYPVKTVYRVKIPMQVIDEYGYWRKVRDWQGAEGWIHRLLLSNKRLGMITPPTALLYNDYHNSKSIEVRLKKDVIVHLKSCKIDWCEVKVPLTNYSGYITPNVIWGLDTNEIFE